MPQKSATHYYDDGDIILVIQDTAFRVHKKYLSLASEIFNDMCATCSTNEDQLPVINLSDDSAEIFEELLSFLYPSEYVPISWDNIGQFLQLADKYEISNVRDASEDFLHLRFMENASKSLVLADYFRFEGIFKESSKLFLNQFPVLKYSEEFKLLSQTTSSALMSRYIDYVNSIGTLDSLDITSGFNHDPLCDSEKHKVAISNKFAELIVKVQVHPIPPPSRTFKILMSFETNAGSKRCRNNFEKTFLLTKLKSHFGEFEPIDYEKRKVGIAHHLFIEMHDS